MFGRSWSSETARREMSRLTAPGVLGFYTHFEATEVFADLKDGAPPINVFTILVAEERNSEADGRPTLLSNRIKLKAPKDWVFGIMRYVKPIGELVPLFDAFCAAGEWSPTGKLLRFGQLNSLPVQFVPPDAGTNVPWNRVLKNNFWNGSYVFEWADPTKTALLAMFDESPALQDLSETVQAHVPIRLASLSDRLGNIVLQLPVNVLMTKFGEMRDSADSAITTAWHPKATARPIRAVVETDYDDAITGFNSQPVAAPETLLPMQDGPGLRRHALWDDENRVLLAASGGMSWIRSIRFDLHVMPQEPRCFSMPDGTGGERTIRVGLRSDPIKNVVGDVSPNPAGEWRQFRMYREETARLEAERIFKQYRPDADHRDLHEEALEDLRFLLRKHGEHGAWLWDPYLTAYDAIETLFYCPFGGSDLRALSGAEGFSDVPAAQREKQTAAERFIAEQRAIFENLKSNWQSMRFEFRVRTGQAGWPFHDRFLIFPAADRGAQAWALGASVNGLGKQHNILQRVDDGQRIRDAFEELWRQLDSDEYRACKKP